MLLLCVGFTNVICIELVEYVKSYRIEQLFTFTAFNEASLCALRRSLQFKGKIIVPQLQAASHITSTLGGERRRHPNDMGYSGKSGLP